MLLYEAMNIICTHIDNILDIENTKIQWIYIVNNKSGYMGCTNRGDKLVPTWQDIFSHSNTRNVLSVFSFCSMLHS